MSLYYKLKCMTCDENNSSRFNHGKWLADIIELAPHFKAIKDNETYSWWCSTDSLNFMGEYYDEGTLSVSDFLIKHIGHDVRVEDEYGKLVDDS